MGQLVNEYNYAFAGNTSSAAIDAYVARKKVFVMLSADRFNLNPLKGYDSVKFITTHHELVEGLMEGLQQYGPTLDSNLFYTDPELPQWKKLLKI